MSVNPDTNQVLLTTHDVLFDVTESPAIQLGPSEDLMGFTTAGIGNLYASGHPGPGVHLPDPAGADSVNRSRPGLEIHLPSEGSGLPTERDTGDDNYG